MNLFKTTQPAIYLITDYDLDDISLTKSRDILRGIFGYSHFKQDDVLKVISRDHFKKLKSCGVIMSADETLERNTFTGWIRVEASEGFLQSLGDRFPRREGVAYFDADYYRYMIERKGPQGSTISVYKKRI